MLVNALDITTRLVYGTSTPGPDPNTHIRPDTPSSKPPSVTYVMADYLNTGAGRYALPSSAPIIRAFFDDAVSIFPRLSDGTYTLAELRTALALSAADSSLNFSVSQYTTDALSSDFIERSYIFGSTGFTLADTMTFTVSGRDYNVNNLEVIARPDNFDFQSSNPVAQTANVALRAAFDPYSLIPEIGGVTLSVDILYSGPGRIYTTYSLLDYGVDRVADLAHVVTVPFAIAQYGIALAGLETNTGYLGSINANNLFSYYTPDGKKIIYGTPGDDSLNTGSAERTLAGLFDLRYQMVGGPGNDEITGGSFADEIWGGDGNDTLSGGLGDDRLIGGAGDDIIEGGSLLGLFEGQDTSVYSGNAIDYDIIHNEDDSWSVNNVRNGGTDGNDTLTGVEFVEFADGQKFRLEQNGILDQTDFAFVIDTTGSMSPYIGGVKTNVNALINQLFDGGLTDAHIAVVSFKDPDAGDPDAVVLPFTTETDLSARQQAAINAINSLGADGGGDIPEGDNSGLLLALDGSAGQWRDSAAIRRIALFTDAPVKDTALAATVSQYAHDLGVTIERHLVSRVSGIQADTFALSGSESSAPFSVQVYTIQVGNNSSATASVQQIATDNGGRFFAAPTPAQLVGVLTQIIAIPVINGTVSDQMGSDNATIKLFASTSIVDPASSATVTATVTLSSAANGLFFNLAGGAFDATTGVYTVSGTADSVTSALDGLLFTPTWHQVAKGQVVTTGFTISITDSGGGSATDNVTSVIATNTGSARGPNDFDGSGSSDILFQNTVSGALLNWRMIDGNYSQNVVIAGANSDWKEFGTGDFDGDGTSDILFQNSNSGAVLGWRMHNGSYAGDSVIAEANSDWKELGTGDFDGDGTSDILFQSSSSGELLAWKMAIGAYVTNLSIGGASADLKYLGTGDFNGDATSDILFQSASTGSLSDLQVSGGTLSQMISIGVGGGTSTLKFLGTGDFNGDATTDILFQDTSSGSLQDWQMANGTLSQVIAIGVANPDWQYVTTGDFSGDATTDILFQNTGSGAMLYWQMAGGAYARDVLVGAATPDWKALS